METLYEILTFAAKGFIVFLTMAAVVVVVASASRRGKGSGGRLRIKRLNERYKRRVEIVRHAVMGHAAYKKRHKKLLKELKGHQRLESNVFILDFSGDIMASAVTSLREEISALAEVCGPNDEVVVRLESPGGAVPNYGLAASQLQRLRAKGIRLVVCVDKIAASGGYMMACVADEIIAAPFAIIGSIGVVASVPNVHRLLNKYGIDYNEMTAGEFKRTVSVFAEISDKGRQKFQEQIEETHGIFKDFVQQNKANLDIDAVATGEYWLASRAFELGLVTQLGTSDEYLLSKIDTANLLEVSYKPPQKWRERFASAASSTTERVAMRVLTRLVELRYQ